MRSRIFNPLWALVCVGLVAGCENSTEPAAPDAGTPLSPDALEGKQLPPGMTLEDLQTMRQLYLSSSPSLAAAPPPSWESDLGVVLEHSPGVPVGDDDCADFPFGTPLPFTFEFYGVGYSSLSANSNGNATFEVCNTNFNSSIPDANGYPILGVLYGDFNPADAGAPNPGIGDLYWNVLGTAPNRRVVITWLNVTEFYPINSNTFQIQLFEGSNAIQFGYNGLDNGGPMNVGIAVGVGPGALYEHTASSNPDLQLIPITDLDGTNICYKPNGSTDYDVTLGPCTFGPELITVDLDIKPWSNRNPINISSRGVIPVAILGSADFDVTTVDVTTLRFGPGEAEPAHRRGAHKWDINWDGFPDLVSHYRTQESGLAVGDTEACVTGLTLDGVDFEGCDAVLVKEPKKRKRHWWWWW
jgi:hypothetical protein